MNKEKTFYSVCIKESIIFGTKIGSKYKSEMDQHGDIRILLPDRGYHWFIGSVYDEYFENILRTRKLKLKKIGSS